MSESAGLIPSARRASDARTFGHQYAVDFEGAFSSIGFDLPLGDDLADLPYGRKIERCSLAVARLDARQRRSIYSVGCDLVRSCVCYSFRYLDLASDERLAVASIFAQDGHFAVREWAWLSYRPQFLIDPSTELGRLEPLTKSEVPNVRRFAVEVTRPRSVWGTHCALLKRDPTIARAFLDGVATEDDRYVQLSVGNWLNDVALLHPEWTLGLAQEWRAIHRGQATSAMLKRGLRRLPKDSARET